MSAFIILIQIAILLFKCIYLKSSCCFSHLLYTFYLIHFTNDVFKWKLSSIDIPALTTFLKISFLYLKFIFERLFWNFFKMVVNVSEPLNSRQFPWSNIWYLDVLFILCLHSKFALFFFFPFFFSFYVKYRHAKDSSFFLMQSILICCSSYLERRKLL